MSEPLTQDFIDECEQKLLKAMGVSVEFTEIKVPSFSANVDNLKTYDMNIKQIFNGLMMKSILSEEADLMTPIYGTKLKGSTPDFVLTDTFGLGITTWGMHTDTGFDEIVEPTTWLLVYMLDETSKPKAISTKGYSFPKKTENSFFKNIPQALRDLPDHGGIVGLQLLEAAGWNNV
jgi:hypothetical protein